VFHGGPHRGGKLIAQWDYLRRELPPGDRRRVVCRAFTTACGPEAISRFQAKSPISRLRSKRKPAVDLAGEWEIHSKEKARAGLAASAAPERPRIEGHHFCAWMAMTERWWALRR